VFDKHFNAIEASSDAIPLSSAAANDWEELSSGSIPINTNGYIYIYVANETKDNVNVHFDDIKVTLIESPANHASDYYPFGLAMDGRSWSSEPYRFGYQGQFSEYDEETGWNAFELRMYDSKIGRWTSFDPLRAEFSPYMAMGNNPLWYVDRMGGDKNPWQWFKGLFGFGSEINRSELDGSFSEDDFDPEIDVLVLDDANIEVKAQRIMEIRQHKPNFWGRTQNKIAKSPVGIRHVGQFTYNLADVFYLSVIQYGQANRMHLNRVGSTGEENLNAFVNTLGSSIPYSKISRPAIRGISASQFSSLFRGTFISRLKPKIRGQINTQLNKRIVYDQIKLIHGGSAGGAKIINNLNSGE